MFDYKHLLPDPVFECDDFLYMRINDIRAIQLKYVDGSPVKGFHEGWSAVSVYTGLVDIYLLNLVRGQVIVTWIVDIDGKRLGDKLTDLTADPLNLLRDAVSSRGLAEPLGLVGDGLQLIEPMLLREILTLGTAVNDFLASRRVLPFHNSFAMLRAPHGMDIVLQYSPGDQTLLLEGGWSVDEAGLCRGIGALSIARSKIIPHASRYLLTITLKPSLAKSGQVKLQQKQSVEMVINGRLISNVWLDPQWQGDGADLAFWLPPELVGGNSLEISFRHAHEFILVGLRLSSGNLMHFETLDPAELMLQFENIGDNCEFGLVQRHFKANPVGLLRFAGLQTPRRLIRLLDDGFGNFGKAGSLAASIIGGEYWIIDHNYGLAYHTFRYPHEISEEEVIHENEIKIAYLKRKFLEDRDDGEKILVYKRRVTDDPHEILALHAALNRLGNINKLLWVTEAKGRHAPGDVEWLGDHLLSGYIRTISLTDANDFDPQAWLLLCRNAFTAFAAASKG